MDKHGSTSTVVLMALVTGLLIMMMTFVPDRAYSEPPQGQPKNSPNQPELSPEEAAGGKQNLQLMRKACDEDVKKLCPDIRPGGGRIMQCLHGQQSNLTPECRQALAPRSSNP